MEREKEKERCDGQMPAFIWERIHAQMPTAMSKGIFTCAHPHTHHHRYQYSHVRDKHTHTHKYTVAGTDV